MELKDVVQAQREFFSTNKTKSVEFRKQQLLKLKQVILKYEPQIYQALQKDLNKSEYETYLTEISIVMNEIKCTIKHLDKWCRPHHKKTSLAVMPNKSFTVHEPYGVVLVLSPWNYPFQLALCPIVGAIAAGNCVVLKASHSSANTTKVIAEMISSNFESHYLYVVEDNVPYDTILGERYDYMFFTGSARVGRIVMRAASEHLTPVSLELGGKSPCIVEKSADIQDTAKKIVWGKLLNAGQTCVAPDYILVDKKLKENLINNIEKEIAEKYGNPLCNPDYPKIINHHHFVRLCNLIDNEKDKIGGDREKSTLKISPVIFKNVTFQSEIMKDEIFGPIIPVLSYTSIEEVLQELKNRPKPLACYIFTKNKVFAEKIIKEVSFGGGCINDCVLHLANDHLPFGGVGNSGMGQYHGYYSFCTFSHEKAILQNRRIFDIPHRFPPFTKKKLEILRKLLGE